MKKYEDVMKLSPDEFFDYVASIRYGYKDLQGNLHFQDEDNLQSVITLFLLSKKLLKITVLGAGK